MTTPPRRILIASNWLFHLTGPIILLLPLVFLALVAKAGADPGWLREVFPGLAPVTTFAPLPSMIAVGIGGLSLLPLLVAMIHLRRLFALYARGEILTRACGAHIRCAGVALVILAAMQVLAYPVQVLVLTAANPPGTRQVAIALNSDSLLLAMAGAVLVVIGWVMAEAAAAAEENAAFV